MKKIILSAALILPFVIGSAIAQPMATEIAFTKTCPTGVHMYDKDNNAVTCGKPSISGIGYVIEMATDINGNAQCPQGYSYIGNIKNEGDKLLHFACAKIN